MFQSEVLSATLIKKSYEKVLFGIAMTSISQILKGKHWEWLVVRNTELLRKDCMIDS